MAGGITMELAHSNRQPGSTLYQHNFEARFGVQGYTRVGGLQRYDGRTRVQDVGYIALRITDETTPLAVGDLVNIDNDLVVAAVVAREDDVLVVEQYPGGPVWNTVGAPVRVGTDVRASVVSGEAGTPSNDRWREWILLAQAAQRARITQPGGAVTGLHAWGDTVYASVDVAGKGQVKRSSAAGWTVAIDNLIAGGTPRYVRQNFGGAAETLGLFCVDGRNRPWRFSSVTNSLLMCPPMVQTNATSTSSVTFGTGDQTFVLVETARAYTVGQAVTVWANADRAKWMSGVVKTWTSGTKTLVITIAEANGLTDTLADWEIGLSDYSDKPFDLVPYGTRMAYAFPNGQLLLSDVGDPFAFTSTAAALGVGDEITGLVSPKGGQLAVFCRGSIYMLTGSTPQDLQMQIHTADTGAKRFSPLGVGGNVVFLSERGVTSLAATDTFGDFQLALSSAMVNDLLRAILPNVSFVKLSRTKMQYRIYLNNGSGVCMTFTQDSGILGVGAVAFNTFSYPRTLVCGGGDEQDTGREVQFVADSDGWVLEEDAGINFDGEPIGSYLHTAFATFGNDQYKKRYRKLEFEIQAKFPVIFNFRQHFDGLDRYYQPGRDAFAAEIFSGGAVWEVGEWDKFVWSGHVVGSSQVNVSGVGRTMGLLIWGESSTDHPYSVQTVTVQYSPLGLQR
jgi:hypothetical protein